MSRRSKSSMSKKTKVMIGAAAAAAITAVADKPSIILVALRILVNSFHKKLNKPTSS